MPLPEYTDFDLSLLSIAANKSGNQFRSTCPNCSHQRTPANRKEQCLSVSVEPDRYMYQCWHCGITGVTTTPEARSRSERPSQPRPPSRPPAGPSLARMHIGPQIVAGTTPTSTPTRQQEVSAPISIGGEIDTNTEAWLNSRGISRDTAKRMGLFTATKFFRKLGREGLAVGFPYFSRNGEPVSVKYRSLEIKDFIQDVAPVSSNEETRSTNIFWRMDVLTSSEPLVITEGEMDAVAVKEAGFRNVTSIPSGANAGKMDYLWAASQFINECEKVILFLDDDAPGRECAEELARRIGRGKCWTVKYPEGLKDANKILTEKGAGFLADLLEAPEPWPVAGLFRAAGFLDRVKDLWANGCLRGMSSGIGCVDELMNFYPGHVSIVTGVPGHGKSEFVDMLMYQFAERYEWSSAICSFENEPELHIPKLAEKYIGKPFFEGPSPRMSESERDDAFAWINEHFVFIQQDDGEPATITSILDRAIAAVQQFGIQCLVIDPYNYIDKTGYEGTETDFISDMLTKVRAFARGFGVHVFLIAHPQKMRAGEDGVTRVPKGYDISGSAAWFAKADLGFTIHRVDEEPGAELHVWKVRFKWLGKTGTAFLRYDSASGRYSEGYDWEAAKQELGGYRGEGTNRNLAIN